MASAGHSYEYSQLTLMRFASFLEGTTLLVLLGVAMPLKHIGGYPVATSIVGPVHGLAFLFYFWVLVQTVSGGGWNRRQILWMMLAAMIPFGGFFNERSIARRQAALLGAG